jgi:CheY-like chemotaxis protein
MSPDLSEELDWDVKLFWRRGGRVRLAGIRVYYEFKWRDLMPNRRMQFRNGQCLAERVRADCPDGKIPALLLTARDEIEEGARITASFFVVVLNLPRYLEQAEANAAVSYLAKPLGPITQARRLQELAAADPKDLRALIQLNLGTADIADWARGDAERLSQLRSIAAQGDELRAAVDALRSLSGLDAELVKALADLTRTETDREKRLDLLRALTEDPTGRYLTGEILGERIEDRLADARTAAAELMRLVDDDGSTETDLQRFLEANPWLLGLDYSHVLARRQILRGTVDFLLARFDGFYDLIELKSPGDPIIVAPTETSTPPSASEFALSPSLARALAQVHVYRDALANEQVANEWFGLPNTRDPRVVIVIGNATKLGEMSGRVLREVNRSLHRVEIVPYDVLGNRANAVLDSVSRQLVAATETVFPGTGSG